MTETVILAAGQTAQDSTDVVITGGSGTISITATGGRRRIPGNIFIPVVKVDNNIESAECALSRAQHTLSFANGTYRVKRPDISAYGVDITVTSST